VAGVEHRAPAQRTRTRCACAVKHVLALTQSVSGGVFLNLYKLYCTNYVGGFEFVKQMTKKSKQFRRIVDDVKRRQVRVDRVCTFVV
jgi:hypothetical protein